MKSFKKYIAIALALVLVLSLTGCKAKPTAIKRPAAPKDSIMHNINGSCSLAVSDGKVTVSGTTGLMNGAIVKISVYSSNGDELASKVEEISEESYSVEFELDPEWKGEIYGFLSCTPESNGKQPKAVREAYGKNFLCLEGENTIWNAKEVMFVLMSDMLEIA